MLRICSAHNDASYANVCGCVCVCVANVWMWISVQTGKRVCVHSTSCGGVHVHARRCEAAARRFIESQALMVDDTIDIEEEEVRSPWHAGR